jgi:hypothetical protein
VIIETSIGAFVMPDRTAEEDYVEVLATAVASHVAVVINEVGNATADTLTTAEQKHFSDAVFHAVEARATSKGGWVDPRLAMWKCLCACGTEVIFSEHELYTGVQSCGCKERE